MIGATISRWTMSYFAMALAWLFVALALMVAGVGYPAAHLASPDTLVLVHVVCIGWLSMAMCGALFQFVPVLVARPLFAEKWTLPALGLLTAGLVALLAGFLGLGGRLPAWLWLLPLGALLLVAGFGLVVVDLGLTAWLRPAGPARFRSGRACFTLCHRSLRRDLRVCACGVGGSGRRNALGIRSSAACNRGPRRLAHLDGHGRELPAALHVHARARCRRPQEQHDLGGRRARRRRRGGRRSFRDLARGRIERRVAGDGAFSASRPIVLYGRDVIGIFGARKRRQLELNTRMAVLSFASLAGGGAARRGARPDRRVRLRHLGAFAFLAIFGWLSGLVLAKLYKIVAFLTWLETYGPVMGRAPTPRVQDLVSEARASKWFALYYVAVWFGTADAAGRPTVGIPVGRGDDG